MFFCDSVILFVAGVDVSILNPLIPVDVSDGNVVGRVAEIRLNSFVSEIPFCTTGQPRTFDYPVVPAGLRSGFPVSVSMMSIKVQVISSGRSSGRTCHSLGATGALEDTRLIRKIIFDPGWSGLLVSTFPAHNHAHTVGR